jgi:hypothetical protein
MKQKLPKFLRANVYDLEGRMDVHRLALRDEARQQLESSSSAFKSAIPGNHSGSPMNSSSSAHSIPNKPALHSTPGRRVALSDRLAGDGSDESDYDSYRPFDETYRALPIAPSSAVLPNAPHTSATLYSIAAPPAKAATISYLADSLSSPNYWPDLANNNNARMNSKTVDNDENRFSNVPIIALSPTTTMQPNSSPLPMAASFPCRFCVPLVFPMVSMLVAHMKQSHIVCKLCYASLENFQALIEHARTHVTMPSLSAPRPVDSNMPY